MHSSRLSSRTFLARSTLLLCCMALMGGLFCWLSYSRDAHLLQTQTQQAWLQTKSDIQKAWRDYSHFLDLTVFRLSYAQSPDVVCIIPRALSFLEKLSFQKEVEQEQIRLRDLGRFFQKRLVYGHNKKPMGTVNATFSFTSFLTPHQTCAVMPQGFRGEFSFEVPGLPYVFTLKHTPLSFWQYVQVRPFDLLLFFSITSLALLLGYGSGITHTWILLQKARHRLKTSRRERQFLQEKSNTAEKERLRASERIVLCEKAFSQTQNLALKINNRFGETLHKASALHQVLLKLIGQDLESPAAIHDVRVLATEVGTLLNRICANHMGGEAVPVDVIPVWTKIQEMFQPDFIAKATSLKIKIPKKICFQIDPLVLEVMIYNLLAQLVERLTQNNHLEITFQATQEELQLICLDDGFMLRNPRSSSLKNPHPYILALSPEELSNFARRLGWSLEWQKGEGKINRTLLTIPQLIHAHDNVVHMADFREKL